MQTLDFFFDPISPYSYLAFEQLPSGLSGCAYQVAYRPVLFAAFLEHHGHKGPAEIAPKRAWTMRQVAWLARRHGVALHWPAQHPFNPLALLRLLVACAHPGELPDREQVRAVFRHVWAAGGYPNEPLRLEALREQLAPVRDPQSAEVKDELRQRTDEAIAQGVFGVPTLRLGERLFWGVDSLEMVRACLLGDSWFDVDHWQSLESSAPGISRS